jgi:hypothetical protein
MHCEGGPVVNARPFGERHAHADDFDAVTRLLLCGGGPRRLPGQGQANENRRQCCDHNLDSFYRSLILHHLNLLDYSLRKVSEAD